MADHDFPDDLVALRRAFHRAEADLEAYLERLPRRPLAMSEPYRDLRGARHDAHRGWTGEERAEVDALRSRERDLALRLSRHPWWAGCGDRTGAGHVLQGLIAAEAPEAADGGGL